MKKTIIALLLAAILVMTCGCSKLSGLVDGGAKSDSDAQATEATGVDISTLDLTGLTKFEDGTFSVYYPESCTITSENTEVQGQTMLMQAVDSNTGDNVNIIKAEGSALSLVAVNEDTFKDEICATLGEDCGFEMVRFERNTNGKNSILAQYKAAISGINVEFCQVMVADKDGHFYTVTFTCFPDYGSAGIDGVFGTSVKTISIQG